MKPIINAEGVFGPWLEDEDGARASVFLQLCRQWPALRRWLWFEFAANAKVRKRFAGILKSNSHEPLGARWFAELSGESHAWQEEKRQLKQQIPSELARPYGGLTYLEVTKLVRVYQAGSIDLGTFFLARDWRNSKGKAKESARLMCSAVEFIDAVVSGRTQLLRNFAKALRFLEVYDVKAKRRMALGHVKWWKLQILLYLLRNPRPSYRSRDLRSHLAAIGLEVSSKEIRKFCARHRIQRDMRAGRPRTRIALILNGPSSSTATRR